MKRVTTASIETMKIVDSLGDRGMRVSVPVWLIQP